MAEVSRDYPVQKPRPTAWQWLGYLFNAGLPPDLSGWVAHDTTAPSWLVRHAARWLLRISPFAVAVLIIDVGTVGLRVGVVAMALALGLFYSFAFVVETTDRRAVKAGYPRGYAQLIRQQRPR